jgi:hypothetical protein
LDLRERRLAQIVRDFMQAALLWGDIARDLENDALDFSQLEQLIGDAEDSVLYCLKEECHALFRFHQDASPTEVQAEELFDLVVGALFHETMKLREGFYTTAHYTPRLERMRGEGTRSAPLLDLLRDLLVSCRRRVTESASEVEDLFRQTREQLLIVLRQVGDTGAVARSLVEDPQRTERVFGASLREVLDDVYGDAERGFDLAIGHLLDNGHYEDAGAVLARSELGESEVCRAAKPHAEGMAHYYAGAFEKAVELLGEWAEDGAPGPELRTRLAVRVLAALIAAVESSLPRGAERRGDAWRRIRAR